MEKYLIAQLGARMHYAVPRILHAAGALEHFYTDICTLKGWPRSLHLIPKLFRPAGVKRILGRIPADIPAEKITAFTNFGFEYAKRLSISKSASEITRTYLWAGKTFCNLILRKDLGKPDGVYAFNSAAFEVLRYARARGMVTVLEQTIAPKEIENKLISEEQQLFPDWEISTGDIFAEEYANREFAEWNEADLILCGSDFVREGIAGCGGPVHRCAVVPYGIEVNRPVVERFRGVGPLKILTVGTVGLRKGIPYVLKASKALKGLAHFRIVGGIGVTSDRLKELKSHVEVVGSIPRTEIISHYEWADVFLLPSLCEGSATVCYEALAAGLPVICTPNTGSIVEDGKDGFIVPIRDPVAIAEKIELLAHDHERLRVMSKNACEKAKKYTIDNYGHSLMTALTDINNKQEKVGI